MTDQLTNAFSTFSRFQELATQRSRSAQESLYERVRAFLGADPFSFPVASWQGPVFGYTSYELARRRLVKENGGGEVFGVQQDQEMMSHTFWRMLELSAYTGKCGVAAPTTGKLDVGPGISENMILEGVHLFRYRGTPVVLFMRRMTFRGFNPDMVIEVLAPLEVGRAIIEELHRLRGELNIYRGQCVRYVVPSTVAQVMVENFDSGEHGMKVIARPTIQAEEIIAPAGLLERLEETVIAPSRHAAELAAAGQHLKRGVLLYGPPGTGKTMLSSYLAAQWPEATVFWLSGLSMFFVSQVMELAAMVAPALIVLDDADQIGESRDVMRSEQAMATFALLEAMDGLDGDRDVAFVLTTNRAGDLEEALLSRPGRVDVAFEIGLPAAPERRRLLERYTAGLVLTGSALTIAAERSEGLTASAFKEIGRRTELRAAEEGREATEDDLFDSVEEVVAMSQLFVESSPEDANDEPAVGELPA